jgi:hypothetical protein
VGHRKVRESEKGIGKLACEFEQQFRIESRYEHTFPYFRPQVPWLVTPPISTMRIASSTES